MTRQQFIAYVEDNQSELRRFLTALCCGDHSRADDIAQESLLKAFLSCDGLEKPDKFKAWLFRIAFNTYMDSCRLRRETVSYDALTDTATTTCADDAFKYQALYAALDRIPERERTAILLFYMEGYPTNQIADIVNVGDAAVRQMLSRARTHLRSLLTANNT